MIFIQTYLKVLDNTGALLVQCIKTLKKTLKKGATIANIILVVVKKLKILRNKHSKKISLKKKFICLGLIVRINRNIYRFNGSFLKFFENSVILLNKQYVPLGSRIFGPIAIEIRNKKYLKIVVMAGLLF